MLTLIGLVRELFHTSWFFLFSSCFGLLSPNPTELTAFLRRRLSVGNFQCVLESARWHGKNIRAHVVKRLAVQSFTFRLYRHGKMKVLNNVKTTGDQCLFSGFVSEFSCWSSHEIQVWLSFSFKTWRRLQLWRMDALLTQARYSSNCNKPKSNQRFLPLLVAWLALCTNNGGSMDLTFKHFGTLCSSFIRV